MLKFYRAFGAFAHWFSAHDLDTNWSQFWVKSLQKWANDFAWRMIDYTNMDINLAKEALVK